MTEAKKEELSTEYPKSLYAGGDRNAPEKTVRSADEERAARADGFAMIDKTFDAAALKALGLEAAPETAEDKKPETKPKKTK